MDPDPDLERGLKWIRPNAVDPGGSRSGSATLIFSDLSIITNVNSSDFVCTYLVIKWSNPTKSNHGEGDSLFSIPLLQQ